MWFKNLSREADCQLGGVPRKCQHSVSMGGVPKWAFLASADMWMTPKPRQKETFFRNPILYSYSPVPNRSAAPIVVPVGKIPKV